VPPLALDLYGHIPRSGGLGGSAAAIVAGLVAANALEGDALDKQGLLELANQIEGHPDNVAPALLGGLVICVQTGGQLIAKRVEPPRELRAVVYLPDHAIPTRHARGILPSQIERRDAVFNLSRAALLVAAIQTRDWALLREAMDDKLHQPARATLLPALYPTIRAAVEAGAHGAALSGSGAAILALATERLEEVAAAMQDAARAHGAPGRAAIFRLASEGASVRYPAAERYGRHQQ
jgi:homoserine kinase